MSAAGARILGVDYGRRRIGIAVSDPLGVVARGVAVLDAAKDPAREISRLAAELGATAIVVGMPLRLDGAKGPMAREVDGFIALLEQACGLPVIPLDERFSSEAASSALIEAGVRKKRRREKGRVDRTAAAIILQDYLDNSAPA